MKKLIKKFKIKEKEGRNFTTMEFNKGDTIGIKYRKNKWGEDFIIRILIDYTEDSYNTNEGMLVTPSLRNDGNFNLVDAHQVSMEDVIDLVKAPMTMEEKEEQERMHGKDWARLEVKCGCTKT